jgi:hypothetical protein
LEFFTRPKRHIAGSILIGLVAAALIGAASGKLVHAAPLERQLIPLGFNDTWITILGVIELGSAVLLAIPRTRALGFLLVTAFLGGAIATHIQHAQSPASPALLLSVCWIGIWLRHPAANWSRPYAE